MSFTHGNIKDELDELQLESVSAQKRRRGKEGDLEEHLVDMVSSLELRTLGNIFSYFLWIGMGPVKWLSLATVLSVLEVVK
jgi:hypothetical protein